MHYALTVLSSFSSSFFFQNYGSTHSLMSVASTVSEDEEAVDLSQIHLVSSLQSKSLTFCSDVGLHLLIL